MEPDIGPIPSEMLPEDKRFKKLPHSDVLFKPPFTCAVLGAIGAGKTSFVYSLIDKHYKKYFDELVVISGTIDSKESWEKINQRNVVFLNALDDKSFKDYINDLELTQEKRKKEGKFPLRVLLVLDDIVFDGYNKNRASVLENLFMTCRHYFISIILCLQHSKQISAAIRNQIFYWVLYRLTANDLAKISEEHSNLLTSKQFIQMYNDYQKKGPREFIIINYKKPMKERFQWKFTQPIDINKYLDITDEEEDAAP